MLAAPRADAVVTGALLPGRDVQALGTCDNGAWLHVRVHSGGNEEEGWCLVGAAPNLFMLEGGMGDAMWEELPVDEDDAEDGAAITYYYWHSGTGESAWEAPRWALEADEASGESYYRDVYSGETQWERPANFAPLLRWGDNTASRQNVPTTAGGGGLAIDTSGSPLARTHRFAAPSPMKLKPSTPKPNGVRHKW